MKTYGWFKKEYERVVQSHEFKKEIWISKQMINFDGFDNAYEIEQSLRKTWDEAFKIGKSVLCQSMMPQV